VAVSIGKGRHGAANSGRDCVDGAPVPGQQLIEP
jgi:hypothetical protein